MTELLLQATATPFSDHPSVSGHLTFSVEADPARETRLVEAWTEMRLHRRVRSACAGRPRAALPDMPGILPPGAGVVEEALCQDMLARARRMAGFDTPPPAGAAHAAGRRLGLLADADAPQSDAGAEWRRWAGHADQEGADLLRARFAAGDDADASAAFQCIRVTLGRMLDHLSVAPAGLLPPVDRLDLPEILLLARLVEIDAELRDDLEAAELPAMLARLTRFCADELTTGWAGLRADLLAADADASGRRAVAAVAARAFNHLVAWVAPLLPFTAEEAWLARWGAGAGSVHERLWPSVDPLWATPGTILANRRLDRLRGLVRDVAAGKTFGADTVVELDLPADRRPPFRDGELARLLGVGRLRLRSLPAGAAPIARLAAPGPVLPATA
ncbi:class I tRNA ligase family protein [Tistrella mobilis]